MLNVKKKILEKKGSTEIIVILVLIIIFSSIAYFSSTKIGSSIKDGTDSTEKIIEKIIE